MSHTPEDEVNGIRRAALARGMMWISLVSLLINVIGSTTFWFALPEKVKSINTSIDAIAARLTLQEAKTVSQSERTAQQEAVLARVDERTKSIQDDVRQLHADFSFRATSKP